jgi:hypothetical protein
MNKAIIIPVYLRLTRLEELPDSEGLALTRRAIESLNILEDRDFTLILPVCFDLVGDKEKSSGSEMDRLLRQDLQSFQKRKIFLFSSYRLKTSRKYLDQKGFKNLSPLIDLKGFSKIRNTGLLLAQALSMDMAIFVDNDEVVEDPQYLKVACEYLNQRWNGKKVSGKGGFYVNPDGTILLPPQPLWWRFFWNKTKWMNQVWEKILSSKDRLIPSPLLLGGNLVLHRSLFCRVPFDPYIPRGEDTDYLINASQQGFCLLFDKQLRIKHLHPERTGVYFYEELKGDIERFLYERRKVKTGTTIDLDPYPGYFMKWTLYPKAILTSLFLSLDYLGKGEWGKARKCLDNIGLLSRKKDEGWSKYLQFRGDWEKMMGALKKEEVNEILKDCWV